MPNRHTNGLVCQDQKMKNYFDLNHPEIYKDADKTFYHRMMVNEYRPTTAAKNVQKVKRKRE